jgi:hypothetical protein
VKTVTIRVTKEDIKHGVLRHMHYCPVALATKRALGRSDIAVFSFVVRAATGDEPLAIGDLLFNSTTRMRAFIEAFDKEKKVKPTSFRVRLEEAQ